MSSRTILKTATLLAALVMVAGAADARAIKWARSGDALTLDPHAQNEGPTHNLLHQIYEPLILRERTGKLLPTLATSWKIREDDPDGVGVQAAPGREVPQRQRLQRRRRGVLARARAAADLRHEGPAHVHRQGEQGRRPHGAHQDQGAQPAGSELSDQPLHDGQGVGRGQQHDHRAGLQGQEGQLRRPQRQRHGRLRAGLARAGREDGAQAQRRLLGQGRGSRRHHRDHLPDDQVGRHARRRAPLGRGRFRAGRAGAGHRPAGEERKPQGQPGPGEPHHLPRHGCRLARAQDLQRQGQEPVRRQARAPGDQHGDRPRGHQARGHARPVGAGGRDRPAVRQRLHQGARRAPQGRPRQGQGAAQGRRLSGRLPGHAQLPQRPLHQRRGHLPGGHRHAGQDRHQGEPGGAAEGAALHADPEAAAGDRVLSAGLGRADLQLALHLLVPLPHPLRQGRHLERDALLQPRHRQEDPEPDRRGRRGQAQCDDRRYLEDAERRHDLHRAASPDARPTP